MWDGTITSMLFHLNSWTANIKQHENSPLNLSLQNDVFFRINERASFRNIYLVVTFPLDFSVSSPSGR